MIKDTTKQWMQWLEQNGANGVKSLTTEQHNEVKRQLSALPHFSDEATTEGKVYYVGAELNPKDPSETRLALYIFDDAREVGGWWRGSLAEVYCQGNDSNKTRKQKTMEQLAKVGVTSLQDVPSLIGKQIPIWVKGREYNGNQYYDIAAIGGGGMEVPEAIPFEKLFGSATAPATNTQVAPATPAAAPAANPASVPPAFM